MRLLRSVLDYLEDSLVSRILELRRRGYGYERIAKEVFGSRNKKWFVMRLLRRLESFSSSRSVAVSLQHPHHADGALHHNCTVEPEDVPLEPKTHRRLGPVQRLVLSTLNVLLAATPAMILLEARRLYGLKAYALTRNKVWQALKRLERRGLVERLPGGYYRVRRSVLEREVLVENLRVNGVQVWSRSETGYPLILSDALVLAQLRGLVWPVDQVEMFLPVPRLNEKARALRSRGWGMTVIYYNESQGLKVEHRFYSPLELHACLPEKPRWLSLFDEATKLAFEALQQLRNGAP